MRLLRKFGRGGLARQGCAFGTLLLIAFPSCAQLADNPSKTVELDSNIIELFHRTWQNGHLAVWERLRPSAMLFSSEGKRLWNTELAFEGAARISITSMGVWPDGTTVVGGGTTSTAGTLSSFLTWISADGIPIRTVRITPFVPIYLKVAPSGKLWAFGRVFNPPNAKSDSPHQMLRRFSKDGLEELAVLSRDTFGKWPHPAVGAGMAASDDRVRLYIRSTGELIELSAVSGEELSRTTVRQPEGFRLLGMAVKADGTVYLSGDRPDNPTKRKVPTFARLDKGTAHWIDVESEFPPWIVGSDGDSLVLSIGGWNRLQWRREP